MSYVQTVLQPGEKIIRLGRLHWIVYWPAILLFAFGILVVAWLWSAGFGEVTISTAIIVFGVLFVYFFVRAWFERWITEIAVTDRRIIYKRGLIYRHTEEMNMSMVSSVDVNQSILGRVLDYGNVHVVGTGGAPSGKNTDELHDGIEHLHRVAAPLALRNAITAK
jgi:uncharacterized membrane protein YdbT with pleckstrin-like domain